MTIDEAIRRVAGTLEDGWEIHLCVEHGAAWVVLYDENGDAVNFDSSPDRDLAEQIDDALVEANSR